MVITLTIVQRIVVSTMSIGCVVTIYRLSTGAAAETSEVFASASPLARVFERPDIRTAPRT